MSSSSRKITFVQILTVVMIILVIVWEKNVQDWMEINDKHDIMRSDLMVIVPLIATLVAVSILQFVQNRRKDD